MQLIVPFVVGLAVMMVLMIKTKIGPFVAMLMGALFIGMACGVSGTDTVGAITTGFGNTCRSIGIVIIFGSILGEYLEKSNASQRIAATMLKLTGEKNADIAMASTGYLVSIPVFVDVALVMLAPVLKAVARKAKAQIGPLAVSLAAALLCTNTFVAPTPAPLSIVSILGIDIGESILWGLIVAAVGTVSAWIFSRFFLARKPADWYGYSDTAEREELRARDVPDEEMPGFLSAVSPILLPIVLILLNTTCKMVLPEGSPVLRITSFVGNSNIALALGTLFAVLILRKRLPKEEASEAVNNAMKSCGPIIFITAAGGALAKVIDATGVGGVFAEFLAASSLPVIMVPFLICGFSKFAQGSGSVACIMAATLTLPLVTAGSLHPIVAFLAICAGSQFGSHVNNSFFWVFVSLFGFDTKTGLKTLVVGQHVIAFSALAAAYAISLAI